MKENKSSNMYNQTNSTKMQYKGNESKSTLTIYVPNRQSQPLAPGQVQVPPE
jgi:hypothetical protein